MGTVMWKDCIHSPVFFSVWQGLSFGLITGYATSCVFALPLDLTLFTGSVLSVLAYTTSIRSLYEIHAATKTGQTPPLYDRPWLIPIVICLYLCANTPPLAPFFFASNTPLPGLIYLCVLKVTQGLVNHILKHLFISPDITETICVHAAKWFTLFLSMAPNGSSVIALSHFVVLGFALSIAELVSIAIGGKLIKKFRSDDYSKQSRDLVNESMALSPRAAHDVQPEAALVQEDNKGIDHSVENNNDEASPVIQDTQAVSGEVVINGKDKLPVPSEGVQNTETSSNSAEGSSSNEYAYSGHKRKGSDSSGFDRPTDADNESKDASRYEEPHPTDVNTNHLEPTYSPIRP